jgi:preprotein translocase subunit SecF
VSDTKHSIWTRLYRGETSFDFVGRRHRWYIVSGTVILIGLIFLVISGLNFSIDFKGGTVWEVPSTAPVTEVRDVIGKVSNDFRQANIQILTDAQTGKKTVRVSAQASTTKDKTKVTGVSDALATMAHVSVNQVTLNDVGASWGHDITNKAIRALIIFLIAVSIYITFRFEGKMAIAAFVALIHDILVTVGVYALSGLQVSPATVIAFLTILGYSLYDTIVVFDKVEENVKGIGASGRMTYSDTVNLSMNQVLMRSINTSLVAIMPILSILVIGSLALGASALEDFGLALFIGLLTGAYSSIFIASPVLAELKEREPRYIQIRQRLAAKPLGTAPLTPAAAAVGVGALAGSGSGASRRNQPARSKVQTRDNRTVVQPPADGDDDGLDQIPAEPAPAARPSGQARPRPAARSANRPPPRPRKKGRRR